MIKDITRWQDIPSIPYVVFKERVAGEWNTFTTNDTIAQAGKQLVFSLPGAVSYTHLTLPTILLV